MDNNVLTFFGRIETGKGIQEIIQTGIQILEKKLPATLAIFGDGKEVPKIFGIATKLQLLTDEEILNFKLESNQVYYFGKRDLQKVIIPFLKKNTNFTYLPSLTLETLGLSALESLKIGIPVIGYKKGGLTSLIADEYNLSRNNLAEILNKPSKIPTDLHLENVESWLEKVKKYIPDNTKKIAILNDYFEPIGGTEKHIHQISKAFIDHGYQVKILTNSATIQMELAEFNPDVIWVHNFLRKLRPNTLKIVNQFKAFKIHTIHDLGLFTTFPSKFQNQNLLPMSNSFIDFYKTNTAPLPIALYKWLKLIKPSIKELKKFNLIIVLHQFYQNSAKLYLEQDPIILPHFID